MTTDTQRQNQLMETVIQQSQLLEQHVQDHRDGNPEQVTTLIDQRLQDQFSAFKQQSEEQLQKATQELKAIVAGHSATADQLVQEQLQAAQSSLQQANETTQQEIRAGNERELTRFHQVLQQSQTELREAVAESRTFMAQKEQELRAENTAFQATVQKLVATTATELNQAFQSFSQKAIQLIEGQTAAAREELQNAAEQDRQQLEQATRQLEDRHTAFQAEIKVQTQAAIDLMNQTSQEFIQAANLAIQQKLTAAQQELQSYNQETQQQLQTRQQETAAELRTQADRAQELIQEADAANRNRLERHAEQQLAQARQQLAQQVNEDRESLRRSQERSSQEQTETFESNMRRISRHGEETTDKAVHDIKENARRERNLHILVTAIGIALALAGGFGAGLAF